MTRQQAQTLYEDYDFGYNISDQDGWQSEHDGLWTIRTFGEDGEMATFVAEENGVVYHIPLNCPEVTNAKADVAKSEPETTDIAMF